MSRALVVGVGNPWRRDDGVGLHVVRRLRPELPTGAEALEHDGEPAGLLELWTEVDAAFVVDAVRSRRGAGTVHRLDAGAGPLPATLFHASTHALGLPEAVELGRTLGRLPDDLVVFGIEGQSFGTGDALSPAVEAAVPALVAAILAEVRQALARV